jgi:LPXTG-site transpeptidase (sortase) family protein
VRPPRRLEYLLAPLLLTMALTGCSADGDGRTVEEPAAESTAGLAGAAHETGAETSQLDAYRSPRRYAPVSEPMLLRIPSIGVTTELSRLGRAEDLTVEVPADPARAGWYAEGPRPGQLGPAVILGHVDTRDGPAVFSRLPELQSGDQITVERADGTAVTFRVTRTEQVAKDRFPTDKVYLPTLKPEIRLVTCGGTFDRSAGHYRDNVIAYGVLES